MNNFGTIKNIFVLGSYESLKRLKSWIILLRQKCLFPLVWTVSKCAFISKIWYYGTICTSVQCFKNVLSFSIEADLCCKARITNITFESLLSSTTSFLHELIQRVNSKSVLLLHGPCNLNKLWHYQTPEELNYTFMTEMFISFSLDTYKMCFHFQNLVH